MEEAIFSNLMQLHFVQTATARHILLLTLKTK